MSYTSVGAAASPATGVAFTSSAATDEQLTAIARGIHPVTGLAVSAEVVALAKLEQARRGKSLSVPHLAFMVAGGAALFALVLGGKAKRSNPGRVGARIAARRQAARDADYARRLAFARSTPRERALARGEDV